MLLQLSFAPWFLFTVGSTIREAPSACAQREGNNQHRGSTVPARVCVLGKEGRKRKAGFGQCEGHHGVNVACGVETTSSPAVVADREG